MRFLCISSMFLNNQLIKKYCCHLEKYFRHLIRGWKHLVFVCAQERNTCITVCWNHQMLPIIILCNIFICAMDNIMLPETENRDPSKVVYGCLLFTMITEIKWKIEKPKWTTMNEFFLKNKSNKTFVDSKPWTFDARIF